MVIDVAQQQAGIRFMNNNPDITTCTHRPKVRILATIDAMKLHPRIDRINLQIKSRRLDRLLLIARQSSEAIGERIRDAKFHERITCRLKRRNSPKKLHNANMFHVRTWCNILSSFSFCLQKL